MVLGASIDFVNSYPFLDDLHPSCGHRGGKYGTLKRKGKIRGKTYAWKKESGREVRLKDTYAYDH